MIYPTLALTKEKDQGLALWMSERDKYLAELIMLEGCGTSLSHNIAFNVV
jgi:hypothetical protein